MILAACDHVRDETLVDAGVRLEDVPGKPSVWKLEEAQVLRAELAEKAAAKEEEARKKLLNKLDLAQQEIKKWEGASIPLAEFWATAYPDKYDAALSDRG